MRSAYIPSRGDIIHCNFHETSGHEMDGPHFAIVMTARRYNDYRERNATFVNRASPEFVETILDATVTAMDESE